MFGFDDIAGFAHNLETAFDRLRNGQLAATADLINLTLAAGDQIKTMLDGAAGRGTVDQARSSEILAELRQLTGSAGPPPDTTPSPAPQDSPASGLAHEWRIRFRPGPNVIFEWDQPAAPAARTAGIGPAPDRTRYRRRFRRSARSTRNAAIWPGTWS